MLPKIPDLAVLVVKPDIGLKITGFCKEKNIEVFSGDYIMVKTA